MRLELIAYRLTADCSTIELYRQKIPYVKELKQKKPRTFDPRFLYIICTFYQLIQTPRLLFAIFPPSTAH